MTHYRTNIQKLQLVVMVLALPIATLAFTTPAQSTIKNQIHIANQNLHSSNTSPSFFLPAVPVPAPARRIKSSFATTSDNDHEIIDQPFKHNHGLHPLLNKAWGTRICTSITKQDPKAFTLLAATLIMASTIFTPQEALAARSGGRMGGSFGGSARSSRSYSSPSRSSGGYSRGYGGGYGGGYNAYRSSPIIVAPSVGGYGNGGYGYGASGMTMVSRGPSFIDVIILGVILNSVLSIFSRNDEEM
jgi:hypothetical protein